MNTSTMIIISVIIIGGIAGLYLFSYLKEKKQLAAADNKSLASTRPLQLQAYERLVLLADRIALPNIISRVNETGMTCRDMQMLLTQTIKQEFEHNITQQIYVSNEAWEAVRNLKEQNILIINQVSSFLPENATGVELNKSLMQVLIENPRASLHTVVSEALSYEAKKLL